ncbi:hypothetical protein GCM10027612_84010 [Microbispora bryophytorum subsp. camponoti]
MTILRPALPLGRFYLDRVTRPDTRTLIAERMLDAREDYLRHHLVRGVPTMPGCFAAELAAEAAQELVPDLVVTGLRDLSFESFLKLGGGTGLSPLRLVARLRGRDDDAESAVVDVQVLGDVVSPREPCWSGIAATSRQRSCSPPNTPGPRAGRRGPPPRRSRSSIRTTWPAVRYGSAGLSCRPPASGCIRSASAPGTPSRSRRTPRPARCSTGS